MNDRQLKYILTIVEEGNLTAAAQKLYISQPSLSGLLASIEENLGVKLFDRSTTPMALTYAGNEFVKSANEILAIYSNLQQTLSDIKEGHSGIIKVGCGTSISPYLIPKIIPGFMNMYPKVQIDLFEYDRNTLEQRLITGSLDITINSLTGIGNKYIDYLPLYSEELMLITAKSCQMPCDKDEKQQKVDLRNFANEVFVLLKPTHQSRKEVDRIFEKMGVKPNIILETDNSETCLRLAEAGMACTILPVGGVTSKHFDYANHNISMHAIDADYKRYLCLCIKKDAYRSRIIDAFYEHVTSLIKETV